MSDSGFFQAKELRLLGFYHLFFIWMDGWMVFFFASHGTEGVEGGRCLMLDCQSPATCRGHREQYGSIGGAGLGLVSIWYS